MKTIYIDLKEFITNYKSYFDTDVYITDSPFYVTDTVICKYYLHIGKRGGCTVVREGHPPITISTYDIEHTNPKTGIVHNGNVIIPSNLMLRHKIAKSINYVTESIYMHKRNLKRKEKELKAMQSALKDNPELLI